MAENASLPKLQLGVRVDKKAFYRDMTAMRKSLKEFVEFTNKVAGNTEIMRVETAQASKTLSATNAKVKANERNTKELAKQTKELQRQGNEISKKVKGEQVFGKQVGRATNAVNAQAKALNNKNKKVRLASTQLSYAIDDMQYGFRGVQNNIAQVALMMGAGGPLMIGITLFTVAIATLLKHQEGVLAALKGTDAALESFNRKARNTAVKEFSGELVKMIASLDLLKAGLLENHMLMDSFVKGTLKLSDGITSQGIFDASMMRFEDLHIQKEMDELLKQIAKPLANFGNLLNKNKAGKKLSQIGTLGQMAVISAQTGEEDIATLFNKFISLHGLSKKDFVQTRTVATGVPGVMKDVQYGSYDKIIKLLTEGTFTPYLDRLVQLQKQRKDLDPDEAPGTTDTGTATGMTDMAKALSEARFQKALNTYTMSKQDASAIYLQSLEAALKQKGTAEERLGLERAIAIEKAKSAQLDEQMAKSALLDQSRKRLQVLETIGGNNASILQYRIESNKELIKSGQLNENEIANLKHQNELYDMRLKKIKDQDIQRKKSFDYKFALMGAETPVQRAQLIKDDADVKLADVLLRKTEAEEIKEQIDKLKEEAAQVDKNTDAYKKLDKQIQDLIKTYQALVPATKEVQTAEHNAEVATHNLAAAKEDMMIKTEGLRLNSMVASGAIKLFTDSFKALGSQDSGAVLKSLLDPLGDFMIKLGKGLVLTGIGKEALSKLWSVGGGIGAIAAGAALIAGGSLIKAAQSANPAGGSGAGRAVGSAVDPVVATPTRQQGYGMNKLEARITGQDLRFVLEKTNVSQRLYD